MKVFFGKYFTNEKKVDLDSSSSCDFTHTQIELRTQFQVQLKNKLISNFEDQTFFHFYFHWQESILVQVHTNVGRFFDFQVNLQIEFRNFKNLFGTSYKKQNLGLQLMKCLSKCTDYWVVGSLMFEKGAVWVLL